MNVIIGRIFELKVLKKSINNDWYILNSPLLNKNVFLHISNCRKEQVLNINDNIYTYIVDYDSNKNRYNGSLKTADKIMSIIKEFADSKSLSNIEKSELIKVNFTCFKDSSVDLRKYLETTIYNYKKAKNYFKEKNFHEALNHFRLCAEFYNSSSYVARIEKILNFLGKIEKITDLNSRIDFLEIVEKRDPSNKIIEDEIEYILNEHKFKAYHEVEKLIQEERYDESAKVISRMVSLFGKNEKLISLESLQYNKAKEKIITLRKADEKGFYKIIDNKLSDLELKKYDKFYLTPYYRYESTDPYTIERDFTANILNFKDGKVSIVKSIAEKFHHIIPNDDVVLCFVPSSDANKEYFSVYWKNYEKYVDKDKPINPPLADLIYTLTEKGIPFNTELSEKNYVKISDVLKRIDGSTVLKRTKSIPSAHMGGIRDKEMHEKTIIVNNKELVKNKVVWLIDDVVTSGSSLKACESLLLKAGAQKVMCITIGKTTEIMNTENFLSDFDL